MKTADVIVIGGGAVGASVAYFLAREGLSVILFERDALAAQASGAAAGMLAPICECEQRDPFFDFALRSLAMFPNLTAELRDRSGVDPQFVPSGALRVALSDTEAAEFQSRAVTLRDLDVEWWDADTLRRHAPYVHPDARGALWSPREAHVYSPHLVRAYAQAAAAYGATIRIGDPVHGLIRDGDRVLGVETESGRWGAAHVVLAAGVWTRFCAAWLGEPLPLTPVRGQILALETPFPAFPSIVWGTNAYLVPKIDGTVVVGATVEHVGFDRRNTAAGVSQMLAAAPELVPSLADATFLRAWAGLRPDTPDHLPVIGPIPAVEGLTVAAGHYRNGVLLSPVTGQLVADWIIRHEFPVGARPFLPQRLLRGRR